MINNFDRILDEGQDSAIQMQIDNAFTHNKNSMTALEISKYGQPTDVRDVQKQIDLLVRKKKLVAVKKLGIVTYYDPIYTDGR